jgi:hypothetical protein
VVGATGIPGLKLVSLNVEASPSGTIDSVSLLKALYLYYRLFPFMLKIVVKMPLKVGANRR